MQNIGFAEAVIQFTSEFARKARPEASSSSTSRPALFTRHHGWMI